MYMYYNIIKLRNKKKTGGQKMKLAEIKDLDREVLTIEELNDLECEEFVERVECLGASENNKYYWYDVTLTDDTRIDVYTEK